jgi:hypothetical protein
LTVKVSLLDLTVDQVEALEEEMGKPVDAWTELPSRMKLYRRIYSLVTGVPPETVGLMTVREITESVSMGDDEDAETENPTEQATG